MTIRTKERQELETPIEIKKGELGQICAIQETNRQVLIDAINTLVDSNFYKGQEGASYLRVALSGEQLGCSGGSVDYKTETDVPEYSVPCPCGNPKHWLIKYDEEGKK